MKPPIASPKLDSEFRGRGHIEDELEAKTHDLGERVKELHCLYGLSKLAMRNDLSLPQILTQTAELLPPGWHYPEITCARIVIGEEEYSSRFCRKTRWCQSAPIFIEEGKIGSVEVYYLKVMPELDEGPFLKEERNLINAIAAELGHIVERHRREEALRFSEAKLREQKKALEQKNYALREILEQMQVEKKKIQEDISANIEELILPNLEKLHASGPLRQYVHLIRKDLEDLASSFGRKISDPQMRLSPKEVEICNLIKRGLTNKEIARLLNISHLTAEKHRNNIRRKLLLRHKDINLATYLKTLQ